MKLLSPSKPTTPRPGATLAFRAGQHSAYEVCLSLNRLAFHFLCLLLNSFLHEAKDLTWHLVQGLSGSQDMTFPFLQPPYTWYKD